MNNKINLIKKIRNITQISILKCKNALIKNNFDLNKTLKYLKNKKFNFTKNSNYEFINTKTKKNKAVIIKFSCETDFVSKTYEFKIFSKNVINFILNNKNITLNYINNIFEKEKNYLISKFNENIIIKKIFYLKNKYVSSYNHLNKIGVILSANKINNKKKINKKKLKKIAVHIASTKTKFINLSNIPNSIYTKTKNKLIKLKLNKYNYKKNIKNKLKEICLLNQYFLYNNNIKIKKYLNKNNINILNFYKIQIK